MTIKHEKQFEQHVATYTRLGEHHEMLIYRRPESSYGYMVYTRRNGYLIVTGDFGCAIYLWSCFNSLEWISGLDTGYFKSKCEASPQGRDFSSWDSDKVIKRVIYEFRNSSDIDVARILLRKFRENGGVEAAQDNEFQWQAWVNDNGHEYFGDDHWEWSYDAGKVIDIQCELHLDGLRHAFRNGPLEAENAEES